MAGTMLRITFASLSLILLARCSALGQDSLEGHADVAETTAGEIERLRKRKLQSLRPETLPWLHNTILYVRQNRIPEKITYGYKGFRPRFGTLGPGSGFGAGIEYFRPNLSDERYSVRSSVTASLLEFFMVDGEFEARRLAGKGTLNVLAFHRFSPTIDFYGVGNSSSLANRSAYSLEENNIQVSGAWQVLPRLRAGGFGRYFTANVGRTRDEGRIPTETVFPGTALPGLRTEEPYAASGAFLELVPDERLGASPGGTRAYVRWSRFHAQGSGVADFTRLEAFAERNQLFLNQQRAFLLSAHASLNKPDGQDSIPFYLQPQLGGPDDLRGFAGRRFYDNNVVSATAEYQWQIFSGVWLAVFSDAGKVFPRWNEWSTREVQTSYGAGVRFGSSGLGAGRFDFAFSRGREPVLDCFRHILIFCVTAAVSAGEFALRIRSDDPIWTEPKPLSVGKLVSRKIDDAYDQMQKTFFLPGKPGEGGPPRASGINTLGEVPDSAWYVNRHGRRRMSIEELLRGPGNSRAPQANASWTILSAKSEGVTPGFVIRDGAGRTYVLKFDTPLAPSSTTAADIIGSKIFYALGYYTPENYIVLFSRDQLHAGNKATITDITGATRKMTAYDVDKLLKQVYRREDGRYRGLASLYVEGDILGPWLYHGTRSDDPNDIYPHEHRRDVRGLYVFAAWLNHYDATSLNTLDAVIEENGSRYVRHYLIDFGSILGSSGVGARDPRNGFVYQYDFDFAWKAALSLGLYAPKWQRANYPDLPEVGRFEAEAFNPRDWKPIYPNPAFLNCLPDDTYWAAKQVMTFTDEEIRRLVSLGQYEDPQTVEHMTRVLIRRRDKIGRTFFADVSPLDDFAVVNGRLTFENRAVKYGFSEPEQVSADWFWYRASGRIGERIDSGGPRLPTALQGASRGTVAVASLRLERRPSQKVDVYLRKAQGARWDVAGVLRSW